MPLAEELLDHASRLLKSPATEADVRRAVSASYYAVFHLIAAAVATQASPASPPGLSGRIQRVLEHRAMKNAMESFRTQDSCAKLSANIGIPCAFSFDLAEIAKAYGELQDARHLADYDVDILLITTLLIRMEQLALHGHPIVSKKRDGFLQHGNVPGHQMKPDCFWQL